MEEKICCAVWTKDGKQEFTEEQWYDFDYNKLHRRDGPAVEWSDGEKWWYVDGKLHRLDGPAIEWPNGSKEWWVEDKQLNTKEVKIWLKENDVDLTTKIGQMAFKLRWS